MTNTLSWLALIFLTLAAYSAGAVLGSRTKLVGHSGAPSPSLLDTMVVVVLWIGAILSRLLGLGAWSAVVIWVGLALVAAFLLNRMQPQPHEGKALPQ